MKREESYTYEGVRTVEVECDRCHAKAPREGQWPFPECEKGNHQRVEVRAEAGNSYPEGGFGTTWTVDLCAKCFVEWLVPLMAEHGVEVREGEMDW